MQSRAALIFVLGFLIFLRAASVHSWASAGSPMTAHGFAAAVLLAAILAGSWYAYQTAHRPSTTARAHRGPFVIASGSR